MKPADEVDMEEVVDEFKKWSDCLNNLRVTSP